MGTVNTFELVFDIHVEKLDGKIRAISKSIKIDGIKINSKISLSLRELINSLYLEGNYYIFTCSCGIPGCAEIAEGIKVTFEKDMIHWKVYDPISTSGYESYDAWKAAAKNIHYIFNRKDMINNISNALDSIKNKSHNSAEFIFNLDLYLS